MTQPNANFSGEAVIGSADVGRLLISDPVVAEARAREALKKEPQNSDALSMLGAALRQQGKAAAAVAVLAGVVASEPDSAFAQLELGFALELLGQHREAMEAFARVVDLVPTFVSAWCAIAEGLARSAAAAAGDAEVPKIVRSAAAAIRSGRYLEAVNLLQGCVEGAPRWQPGRLLFAVALLADGRGDAAIPVIDGLVRTDPENAFYLELRASALHETGEFHQAISQYEELLRGERPRPGAWISYGRALRTIGRQEECVAAFRRSIELCPQFAVAYRALATVKTIRLDFGMIDTLRDLLARPGVLTLRRAQLHFALAKALEDASKYAESFGHYGHSQRFQRARNVYSAQSFTGFVQRTKATFSPSFLRSREGPACVAPDAIFIVGMPRSGSTLVQEILSAHPQIERTGELRDMTFTIAQLRQEMGEGAPPFPEVVKKIPHERFRALGEAYLARTHARRKRGAAYFVDKYLENFLYLGLIHLMMPNAKVLDVRRNPLDCCLSCFRNYFPEGPAWSHSLGDLGHYYADYVELMAHFDNVLPGRVHRLFYEKLIADPEGELRRLLDYLDVPYAPECLRFYEKEQEIVTISIEQARRPIYADAVGNSRDFEPWLGPLKSALGAVLDSYPAVPEYYPRMQATMSLRLD
ncbi:MAG TPA: sulfotransferase [Rhizomicrobium sp.]|jgi:tetratricopeptide (TPR) repeat protein